MKPDPERVTVTLQAEGPGPPVEVRLRTWLKRSLRTCGLRCVKVEPVAPEQESPPRPTDADGS